jgi:hypothetical protein
MAKMAVSIITLALGLYLAAFVKLGEFTFREHLVRIAETSEFQQLSEGISSLLGSAKTAVKSQIATRLHATKFDADPDVKPEDE